MTKTIHQAAKETLHNLKASESKSPSGVIHKALFEIDVQGQKEWVAASFNNEALSVCMPSEKQSIDHLRIALECLAQVKSTEALSSSEASPSTTNTNLSELDTAQNKETRRSILPSPIPSSLPPSFLKQSSQFYGELAQVLKDILLSLMRSGTLHATESPSVKAAFTRLTETITGPVPQGIARWYGRMQTAIAHHQHDTLIELLNAASVFCQAIETEEKTPSQNKIIATWLGAQAIEEQSWTIGERTCLEIGRERLDGLSRVSIERRYLMDSVSGVFYTEERSCSSENQTPISVGPCPRVIQIGLAEVEPAPFPRRIKLLQYSVLADPVEKHWAIIQEQTFSDFTQLEQLYLETIQTYSALCEPFVIIHPSSFHIDPGLHLLDPHHRAIPIAIAERPGLMQQLKQLVSTKAIQWISGRLIDSQGMLMLVPCSTMVSDGKHSQFIRLV